MTFFITIFWILLLLSILVIIHEFGHFLAAKLVGVHVEEFGLGYPPRAKVLFEKWKTKFSLNYIPLGGFVRLYGDDAETVEKGGGKSDLPEGVTEKNRYSQKSLPARMTILLAGVAVNFVFGILAFAGIYSTIGIPTPLDAVNITDVAEDSVASRVGLQVDDSIIAFLDDSGERIQLTSSQPFITFISERADKQVQLVVRRAGENEELVMTVTPEKMETDGEEYGRLGVGLSDSELRFYPWWQMPFRGMVVGLEESIRLGGFILVALRDMVVTSFQEGQLPSELSGPVGIVDQTYQSGILQDGWLGRLNWMALISVNLAIMNLLPIPALDGGRAVFLLTEPFLGKGRRTRWEQLANNYGMMFLLGLIILITAKDVWQIFVR